MRGAILLVVCSVLALAPALAGAQLDTTPGASATARQASGILPSLRGHMAELGTLMNRLFRHVGDPERTSELIGVTREMEALLSAAGDFEPTVALIEPDQERRAEIMSGFRSCLQRARGVVAELRQALVSGGGDEQKDRLLRLDQVRRDCHAAFG